MAFNSVLFLTVLLAISTLMVAPSAVEAQILARIRGTVNCAVTVTTSNAPAFPTVKEVVGCKNISVSHGWISKSADSKLEITDANAQLRCGAAVISSSITNSLGSFGMQLTNPTAVLINLLSTNCTIGVRTPLAKCNSSLPSAGTLIAPLQSSLPSIDGANIVLNLVAGVFKFVL